MGLFLLWWVYGRRWGGRMYIIAQMGGFVKRGGWLEEEHFMNAWNARQRQAAMEHYDARLLTAVTRFKNQLGFSNAGDNRGVVDLDVWTALWRGFFHSGALDRSRYLREYWRERDTDGRIPISRTVQHALEFSHFTLGRQNRMTMQVFENTVTLTYNPRIFLRDISSVPAENREDIATRVKEQIEEGVRRWRGPYTIYGAPVNVVMNVSAEIVPREGMAEIIVTRRVNPGDIMNRLPSQIRRLLLRPILAVSVFNAATQPLLSAALMAVIPPLLTLADVIHSSLENGQFAPMVPQSAVWNRGGRNEVLLQWDINAPLAGMASLMAHEFGHVLGLFDAYDYSVQAPNLTPWRWVPEFAVDWTADRLQELQEIIGRVFAAIFSSGVSVAQLISWGSNRNDIMFQQYSPWEVTNLNIEMLLLAWRRNALQMYDGSAALRFFGNNEETFALFH